MKHADRTSIGGAKSGFATTHWSIIQAAKTDDLTRRHVVIGNLTTTYWKPVYCYLKRRGYDNEQAKDLTQDFFCEIVLGRGLVSKADREKGRFRTFLLTALERYAVSRIRRDTRRKAAPKGGLVALDFEDLANLPTPHASGTAEEAFHFRWAADLLEQVLAEVKEEYCGTDRAAYWEVFRLKILVPILEDVEGPPLAELCARFGIDNESRAANIIVTVKRRFRAVLRRHLRDLVGSDSEVDDELNEIFRILSGPRAG
ncbi:MAG: sigma-70 family RNA polymerase sigma factor [Sedimentisphaerales bacterium]|nr:sigma-70 family RNA polymerase sigma factor [Sedimentisphaerales bacterium]